MISDTLRQFPQERIPMIAEFLRSKPKYIAEICESSFVSLGQSLVVWTGECHEMFVINRERELTDYVRSL